MKTRDELPEVFEKLGYRYGAEVGVKEGNFSRYIGDRCHTHIYTVDIWQLEHEYELCKDKLQPPQYTIIRKPSVEASKQFQDGELDWVYIDAAHDYTNVKADYEAWYPKVRKGGMICGHDYGVNDCIGVKEYIDERIAAGDKFEFTTEDYWNGHEYQTWWKIKE